MFEIQFFDFTVLLWTGGFCLIWAAGFIVSGPRSADPAAVALILISAIRLLWECYFLSHFAYHYSLFFGIIAPVTYLIGPILFFYYERLADRKLSKYLWVHFFPAILSFIPAGIWIDLTELQRVTQLLNLAKDETLSVSLMEWWVLGPKISIFLYSLWIPLRRSSQGVRAIFYLKPDIKHFSILLLSYVWIMILSDIAGYLLNIDELFRFSAMSHGMAAVIVYLYSRRNPNAMLEIKKAVRSSDYQKSKLSGINIAAALNRIQKRMQEESFYADEDLRLANFAEACDLNAHQLSELLNTKLGLSFNRFVNRYRIQAACKIFQEERDRNVLSVAMAVGFNSRSAFHRAFREEMHMTAQEYRQKNIRL